MGDHGTTAAGRARPPGGLAHVLSFLGVALVIVWSLWALPRLGARLLGPEAVDMIGHLSVDETITVFAEADAPTLREKRLLLRRWTPAPVSEMDDLAVTDLWARVHQQAADLAALREHLTTASIVLLFAGFAAAAKRVAYRPHDVLLLLVPFVQLAFGAKVLWRATSPVRYWAPAPARDGVGLLTGFALGIAGAFALYALIATVQSL